MLPCRVVVIRRVGGLEERVQRRGDSSPVIRRVGGLEAAVTEPRAKERVIYCVGGLEFLKILRMLDRRAGG